MKASISEYFDFERLGTNPRRELIAGLTTFLAAAYIIVVNPSILAQSGLSFNALVTATVLVSVISTLLMGLWAKNPILVAPGMGLNAFFTYGMVMGLKISPQVALGAVTWSGVIFLILSVFKVRTLIARSIPLELRFALAAGIGLFIALIGLIQAGLIVGHPVTLVSMGPLQKNTAFFFIGLFFSLYLLFKGKSWALLAGMALVTGLSALFGGVSYQGMVSWPDFSLLMELDLKNSFSLALLPAIFSLLFTDLFDSLSTFVAVAEAGNLYDQDGHPRNVEKSLLVDAISTFISGLFGSSPGTSFIESISGIKMGGRSGFSAVISGLLFLPFLFLSPLLSMIPAIATAPALVLVGLMMSSSLKKIDWQDLEVATPCFLGMVLIPFTYSITVGIIFGFLSYTLIKILRGKSAELSLAIYLIDLLAGVALFFRG